ncbi:hypothetical protein TWF481_008187 [Arthrobotrys musiformis]|uniref:Uncharacterized protein n=1 Tax=Arthrobotrys musiformis TaxID=47236 RepID=A0AAV9W8I8_9PEZI
MPWEFGLPVFVVKKRTLKAQTDEDAAPQAALDAAPSTVVTTDDYGLSGLPTQTLLEWYANRDVAAAFSDE